MAWPPKMIIMKGWIRRERKRERQKGKKPEGIPQIMTNATTNPE
jgi:hypothetical protein